MGIYSKDELLNTFVEQTYIELMANDITPLPESFKEINYGVSFKCSSPETSKNSSVSIYRSDKKGFSIVTKQPKIKMLILSMLSEDGSAGSDEAGKGDIFGPLVVSSFFIGNEDQDIFKLNIKDSKHMKDSDVISFYKEIIMEYGKNYSTIRIMPERYNSLYLDMRSKGKNLNHILAWAHGKAIGNLLKQKKGINKVIIDQFSSSHEIIRTISNMTGGVDLSFETKGEKHPVVAAASLMARGEYLFSLEKISDEILEGKVRLNSGSGPTSDDKLRFIKEKFPEDIFTKIAKVHFANFSKL